MTPSKSTGGKKRKTQGLAVIRWIETACCFTAAEWFGKPFVLLPWQRQVICELFELDGERRKHRWAYISVPKKNGKTELMAALALWFLIASGEPAPLVACAAGSDDQADLIFGAAKIMCEESPFLRALTEVFDGEIQVKDSPGAKLVRVAASARRFGSNLDGKNIFVVICDELHVWEGDRGEIVWGTLTRGTVARREPMVIQITTAGYDRESICYRQYEHAKNVLADPEFDPAYYAYIAEAPEGADHRDPKVWEAANPSFGTIMHEGFYQDQLSKQPENEFRRFYCNQWTRSADCWLPPGAWEACRSPLEIPDGADIWGGVDVALYHDSTAVACCAWVEDRLVVRSRVWVPPKGGKTDISEVMAYIRELADRYKWQTVAYDPRFFDIPAATLMDEGIPMLEVPQSAPRMVPACGNAWGLIVGGELAHNGDPILEDHVLSAQQRISEGGWTLSKSKSTSHIDACVAMVLALSEATHSEPETEASVWFV